VARSAELGLDRIALTDHNTAVGSLLLKRLAPELAIVGEEVSTTEGDLIGLFIGETIVPGGTPEEVCDLIHAMDGLTYACHPFDRRRAGFSPHRLVELAPRLDVIETHNSWASDAANQAAATLCRELGKVAAAGSDAHAARELGRCWMEMEGYDGADDFLDKLSRARHVVNTPSGAGRRA
jgi:predicted metal-dependent phosphoesterase TrpH